MQLGYRQDGLNDTFWLMVFSESASLIGSQMLANWVVGPGSKKIFVSPFLIPVLLAMISFALTARGCPESPARGRLQEHKAAFLSFIFGGKIGILLIINTEPKTEWCDQSILQII